MYIFKKCILLVVIDNFIYTSTNIFHFNYITQTNELNLTSRTELNSIKKGLYQT